jgi:hypothetical protein
VVIIEGTFLVAGIPMYDENEKNLKYKRENKISPDLEQSCDMKKDELYCFSADNWNRTEGTPKYIIGRVIILTIKDAIEITKTHFQQIKKEKKTVENILKEKPRLWVIGYGICEELS